MDTLWRWWREKPQIIALILVVAFAAFFLEDIASKSRQGEPCPELRRWLAEAADADAFWGWNRPDYFEQKDNMRAWKRAHRGMAVQDEFLLQSDRDEYEAKLVSIMDVGRAASRLQGCGLSDSEMRNYNAPTRPFTDEQRDCFEYYTERRGEYGAVSATYRPGCEQTLIDSVWQIAQNFP